MKGCVCSEQKWAYGAEAMGRPPQINKLKPKNS